MTMVDIDDEIYKQVSKFVKKHDIDYPSIQNFCNKSIRNQLRIELLNEPEIKGEE